MVAARCSATSHHRPSTTGSSTDPRAPGRRGALGIVGLGAHRCGRVRRRRVRCRRRRSRRRRRGARRARRRRHFGFSGRRRRRGGHPGRCRPRLGCDCGGGEVVGGLATNPGELLGGLAASPGEVVGGLATKPGEPRRRAGCRERRWCRRGLATENAGGVVGGHRRGNAGGVGPVAENGGSVGGRCCAEERRWRGILTVALDVEGADRRRRAGGNRGGVADVGALPPSIS